MTNPTSRKVIAFYGFKGGAGRSLLLVNLARAMAQQKRRVLIIDCDLEAPGLGDYLIGQSEPYPRWQENDGIINLIVEKLGIPPDVESDKDSKSQGFPEEKGSQSISDWRSSDGNLGLSLDGETVYGESGYDAEPNLEADDFAKKLFGDGAPLNPNSPDTWLIKAKNDDTNRSPQTGYEEADSAEREGSIYLLGPGTHKAEIPYPQQYAGQVVDLDWHFLITSKEGVILKLFGEALQSREQRHFDYVLIDARTGYNFAAIALVQNWATDLVAVGTPSLQSIDGLARMMPIFSDIGIRCHLAISKALPEPEQGNSTEAPGSIVDPKMAEHTRETAAKKRLIEDFYHRDMKERIYWFDFLEDLKFGDADFWSRYSPDVMSTPYSNKAIHTTAPTEEAKRKEEERGRVEAYARRVYELYAGVTGDRLVSSAEEIGFTFRAKNLNAKTFNQNSAQALERPKKAMGALDIELDDRISAFLERVEVHCKVNERTKSQPPTSLSEPGGAGANPERIATPLVNDAELRDEGLAARDLARMEMAERLGAWASRPEEYDQKRIGEVRRANGLSLLPVVVKDLARADDARVKKQSAAEPDRLVWTAYRGAVQNPSDDANPERIQQARKALNQADRPDEKLKQVLDLAEAVVQGCLRTDPSEAVGANGRFMKLRNLGSKLLPMISPKHISTEFHRPTDSAELIQWNPYDAFLPYAIAASEAICDATSDVVLELVKQLEEAQASVVYGLSRIDLKSENKDDQQKLTISFFTNYLNGALQARRAAWTYDEHPAPHSLSTVLDGEEAAALNRCIDMYAYKASLRTATAGDAVELEIAFGIRLSINIMSLSGHARDAMDMLRELRLRLMRQDHPSNITAEPTTVDASQRYQRYQRYQEWAYFIFDLGHVAAALKDYAEASRLYRLALRTYMPIRRDKNSRDDFLAACSVSLAICLARVGPPIDDRTIEELKAVDPQVYGWWTAARLFVEGQFTDALKLLCSDHKFNDDLSAVMWKCKCQSSLANVVELQQLREHWWDLRPKNLSLFSDQLGDWLSLLHLQAGASLAVGETRGAIELLEVALKHVKSDGLLGTDRLRLALDVRLKLAKLRDASANQNTTLQTRASRLADEACSEIVQFIMLLQEEMDIDCDLDFERYLRDAANDFAERFVRVTSPKRINAGYVGGGVFVGIESPSPLRRHLAEVLTEFAEILFHAKREEDLLWLTNNMKNVLPNSQALAKFAQSQLITFCYPTAAILALRSTMQDRDDERMQNQAEAKDYMRRDIQINQELGREQYYGRIFSACGFGQ